MEESKSHSVYLPVFDNKGNKIRNLKVDAKTGIYYFEGKINGRSRKASLDTANKSEALKRLPAKIMELRGEKPEDKKSEAKKQVLIRDIYKLAKEEKEIEEKRPATLRRFEGVWLKNIEPFLGDKTPAEFTALELQKFIVWHRKNRIDKRTGQPIQLFNTMKYLANLTHVMVKHGFVSAKDVPEIKLPKKEKEHHAKQKGTIVTDDEIKSIVEKSIAETKLLVCLYYSAGFRKMELGSCRLDQIEIKPKESGLKAVIHFDTDDTKTGIPRIVPIPEYLSDAFIAQYSRSKELKSPYLFPMKTDPTRHVSGQIIDKGWVQAKRSAKISRRIRIHDLRHTAATNMAKANINPLIAATALGMTIQRYQKTYLKLTADDLIIAIEAAPVKFTAAIFAEEA